MGTQGSGDSGISWVTIVGAVTVVALIASAQFKVSSDKFDDVEKSQAVIAAQIGNTAAQIKAEQAVYAGGIRTELNDLKARVAVLESEQRETLEKLAHAPVEARTFRVFTDATNKQIDLLQGNINDLNRQIAALLNSVEGNSAATKKPLP